MADRRDGNSSRRGGGRSHYDDRDRRRDHDRRRVRDDDKDRHHHDRSRDHGRDGDRDRDGNNKDHRRYRSRSRDRDNRDRRRSRSPGRERTHDSRRDDRHRDRNKDRGSHRRDGSGRGGDPPPSKDRGDRSVREDTTGRLDNGNIIPSIEKPSLPPRQRTTSPRRSESPNTGFDHPIGGDHPLPTRSKPSTTASGAPVSFKVKTAGNEEQRPVSRGGDEDTDTPRGRFDDDLMDEDDEEDVVVEDDGLDQMAAMMGFGGFGTTKNQKVIGNNVGTVKKEKKTEYRQYMNRVGGFNRPLSPPR